MPLLVQGLPSLGRKGVRGTLFKTLHSPQNPNAFAALYPTLLARHISLRGHDFLVKHKPSGKGAFGDNSCVFRIAMLTGTPLALCGRDIGDCTMGCVPALVHFVQN